MTQYSGPRLQLQLGKYRITKVEGNIITIQLGGTTSMNVIVPAIADIRPGDILTFYTEVPIKETFNAKPSATSQ